MYIDQNKIDLWKKLVHPERYTKDWLTEKDGGCLNDLYDQLSPENTGMPRMLSCPCPRCTPR